MTRGSMIRGSTVTQPGHRPTVSRHPSLRTDRQPIFSKRPRPFGHSMQRRVLSCVRHGSRLPLFFPLPWLLRLFAPCFSAHRQCGNPRCSVSFFLQPHPNVWSCSYEKRYDRLCSSRRISSRRTSLLQVALRRCVTKIASPQQSFRGRMNPLFDWKRILYRHLQRKTIQVQAWRPDPRRDFDLFRRKRIRNHASSRRP